MLWSVAAGLSWFKLVLVEQLASAQDQLRAILNQLMTNQEPA